MDSLISDFDRLEKLEKESRLRSLKNMYKHLQNEWPPFMTAFLIHDYAEFMRARVGNGQEASHLFKKTIEQIKLLKNEESTALLIDLEVSACTRLMYYFCLCYEDYYEWSDYFFEIRPDDPVERDNRRIVENNQNNDRPWREILIENALFAYNPFGPKGSYQEKPAPAIGLSAFQFMLKNRRQLRIQREQWQKLMRYCHLAASVNLEQHKEIQEQMLPQVDLIELELIRAAIRPLFKEYVEQNSTDSAVKYYEQWIFQPDFLTEEGEPKGHIQETRRGSTNWRHLRGRPVMENEMWYFELINEHGIVVERLPWKRFSATSQPSRLNQKIIPGTELKQPMANLGTSARRSHQPEPDWVTQTHSEPKGCLPRIGIVTGLAAIYQGIINYNAGPELQLKGITGFAIGVGIFVISVFFLLRGDKGK